MSQNKGIDSICKNIVKNTVPDIYHQIKVNIA